MSGRRTVAGALFDSVSAVFVPRRQHPTQDTTEHRAEHRTGPPDVLPPVFPRAPLPRAPLPREIWRPLGRRRRTPDDAARSPNDWFEASDRFEANGWFEERNLSWPVRLRLWLASTLFGRTSAYHRGLLLLLENLTPDQRHELLRSGYFHVVGGSTGRRYRISRGRQLNVHQLDAHNRRICIWCFYPSGHLVEGDVMLAQKLALEVFEDEALNAANRLSNYFEPISP